MIITATSRNEAVKMEQWLADSGYTYKGSLWYSQEWVREDEHVFLHKGYNNNDRVYHEWEAYMI